MRGLCVDVISLAARMFFVQVRCSCVRLLLELVCATSQPIWEDSSRSAPIDQTSSSLVDGEFRGGVTCQDHRKGQTLR